MQPERVEVADDRPGVEDPHHDALAPDERQRDDAHVDPAAVDRHGEAPVLREAALGDVEVGHDLDP